MNGDDSTLGTMPVWASVTIGLGLVVLMLLLIALIVRQTRHRDD